ncbi:SWIRM-domain-containing protein [Cylindrobasidium torrendii FP15055 ss-10]|uniref:Transcriptional adapter 2 n=1 Tax=Cylindrobasidium torrendii FP15055 ss-10 TaxID=1314674 RepID=A0A0D7B390_9AGAR|nr:SWIRM-domain-containing protein [Cylindrobasidium torrendii FP15055 ss-10]
MTVSQRKTTGKDDDILMNEPGDAFHCDSCTADLTHSVRIKCADPVCDVDEGVDICPRCFCAGKEFANHKRGHPYRVIEINSYPIFTEDWGADEEILLLKGISLQGFGNWRKVAEHVGTRTKEEVARHYHEVYINSEHWPKPPMDREFNVDPFEFQARKRRRIKAMDEAPPPPIKPAPVSLPGIHEIQGYFPGRLEFEHEHDNDAEEQVKDIEFGVVHAWGGDEILEDENDPEVRARVRWEEARKNPPTVIPPPQVTREMMMNGRIPGKGPPMTNGISNGHDRSSVPPKEPKKEDGEEEEDEDADDEVLQPPPIETEQSLAFKLMLLEAYSQRLQRRVHMKQIMTDRGLLDFKKLQANEKKRTKEEREILNRLRPFSQLQSATDYEEFATDVLYEALLRARIVALQTQRRLGLLTPADAVKYEEDLRQRTLQQSEPKSISKKRAASQMEDEGTPKPVVSARKMPQPLNLANSPSLHLLSQPEQVLCSQLRIFPKPYLVIKETLVREYARRGGKLRRREARDLVRCDVNKTSRVWDFLIQQGYLKITPDTSTLAKGGLVNGNGVAAAPQVNGSSPTKSVNGIAGSSSTGHSPAPAPVPGPSTQPAPSLPAPLPSYTVPAASFGAAGSSFFNGTT